jgi:hypothetical protein
VSRGSIVPLEIPPKPLAFLRDVFSVIACLFCSD